MPVAAAVTPPAGAEGLRSTSGTPRGVQFSGATRMVRSLPRV